MKLTHIEVIWASMRDLSSGFPTMQNSNQPAQLQRLARKLASLSIILSRERTTKALIRLRGCVGWSAPLIFECSYVRVSLDTAHKYDNCHYKDCIVFQCFHTLARWHAQQALLIKLKIRGKHKEKWAETRKKVMAESILVQKKWSGARRPAGPATTALHEHYCLFS